MEKFLLYKYVDSAGVIMYIGQTIQDLSKRHYQHCQDNSIYESFDLYYTEVKNAAQLNLLEAMYISKYKPALNKTLKNALPASLDFVDSLEFKRYVDQTIINSKENNLPYDFSKLSTTQSFQNLSLIKGEKEILSLLEYKIILLFYIKSKLQDKPIEEISLKVREYWAFHGHNTNSGKNSLRTYNLDILYEKDKAFFLKNPNILKNELFNLSLETLFFLDSFKSKYSFVLFFYLNSPDKEDKLVINIEDFKSKYNTNYDTYHTLYERIIKIALTELNLKISKKIKVGKRILELALEPI